MAFPVTSPRWCLTLAVLLLSLSACRGTEDVDPPSPPSPAPVLPDAARSRVEADRTSGVVADGRDAVTLTVTVVGGSEGSVLADRAVTLEVSGEGHTLTPASGKTDARGVMTARLVSTVPGGKRVKVSVAAESGPVVLGAQPVIDFVPVPATRLAFTAAIPTATAGAPLSPSIEVALLDAEGHRVRDDARTVTVELASGPASARLGGPLTVTTVDGVASFSGLVLEKAGTGFSLRASAGTLTAATSAPFDVLPAPASVLELTGLPDPMTAGSTAELQVLLKDAFGNLATSYTGTVRFSSTDPAAMLPGPTAFSATDAGRRRFPGVSLRAAGPQTVTAVDSAQASLTGSQRVDVVASAPSRLTFTRQPGHHSVRAPLGPVEVALLDAQGNPTQVLAPAVTVALEPASAELSGSVTVTPSNGTATFSTLSVAREGSGYQLTASAPGLAPATSATFDIVDDVAPAIPVLTQGPTRANSLTVRWTAVGDDGVLGTAASQALRYATRPILTEADFAAATSVPTGAPLPAGSAESVTLSGLTPSSSYHVALKVVDNAGNAVRSASLPVSTDDAIVTQLVFSTPPGQGTAGVNLADVRVSLLDESGMTVLTAHSAVTLALLNGPAFTPVTVNAVSGVATFSGLRIDTAGSGYRFLASSGSLPVIQSEPFTIAPASASTLVLTGPASPVSSGASSTVQVVLRDAFGNVATGYTGTLRFTSTDPAASLPADRVFTAADQGQASLSGVVLRTAGSRTVTATDTVNASLSSSFTVNVVGGAADRLVLTVPAGPVTAGSPFSVQVSVRDSAGNLATGYTGTVAFASSDGGAVLPASYTFAPADAGQKTFSSVELRSSGSQTLTVTDTAVSALSDSHGLTVTPAAVAALELVAPAAATAGDAFSVRLTARDAFANVATGYTGTVHFSSTDPNALLPADHPFTGADDGSRLFSLTALTSGRFTLSATDGTLTVSASTDVAPGAASAMTLSGPTAPVSSGTSSPVQVVLRDAFGNVATSYTGTLRFTSTDPAASLPADRVFTAADQGQASLSGVVLRTAGPRTVTATDTVNASLTGSFTVDVLSGPADRLVLTVPAGSVTAGSPFSIQVSARDSAGNVAMGYTGTVAFVSSDGSAVLPASYTFAPTDAGQKTFSSVELRRSGSQTLTVTDTAVSALSDSQVLTVTPAAVAALELVAPATATAGEAFNVRVTARDAFANVATGYTGTVSFSSDDPSATLPASHVFTSADDGSRLFSLTARTSNRLTLTVTDGTLADSAITDMEPGLASSVTLTDLPAVLTAGTATSLTVTVFDAFGNVATGYTGSVHFTSSDPSAVLPADSTFLATDNGRKSFSVEPRKAGSRTFTVQASGVGSDTATTSVRPASPSRLGFVAQPANGTVRASLASVSVALLDAYANTTAVSSPSVTLSLTGGNPASTLSGSTSTAPSDGVATFPGLSLDQEGNGFRLVAAAPGLTGATSGTFDIVDNLAPAAAVLTATMSSTSSVTVTWRAVGDDGLLGTAASQELRYATSPITTDAAFASATPVSLPAPQPSGTAESKLVTGLTLNTDHYFALKVFDGAGNSSRSNSARVEGDRCLGVTCTPPAATCSASGRAVVTYASSCERSTGTCQNTPTETLCPSYQTCSAGACVPVTAGSQTGRVIVSEFSALGSEFIELRNTTSAELDVHGFVLRNAAGQEVTVRAITDPNGTAGTPVLVPASGVRYGIANPSGAIPGGVGFVYGDPGTGFSLADTGDALALYASGASGKLEDAVDFRSFVTNPNTPLTASHFVGFAGSSTQLEPTVLTAAGNDTATNWCVSFFPNGARGSRITNTAGALNGSCKVAVINEALINPSSTDDGKTFVEIAGPGGSVIGGAKINDVEGTDSATAGKLNADGDLATGETDGEFVIPVGTRIPADGILLVADAINTAPTTTSVPGYTAGVDVLARDMDPENSGGDAIQLVSATGTLLDTVGHDTTGTTLLVNVTTFNGLAMYETTIALTPTDGVNNANPSLARSALSTDTDNNRNDFHSDPSLTPGNPNDAVNFALASLTPDDGPASAGATNISFIGTDFSPGLVVTLGTITATSCAVQSPTLVTCNAPANTGNAVARVEVRLKNPANVGAPDAVLAQGFTYTGSENGTKSAAEADFCNLQFPATVDVKSGQSTPALYGQIYEAGLTEAAGAPAGILAEVGYGTSNSSPISTNSWRFFAASYNVQVGNNDEFTGLFTAPTVTSSTKYSYTFRFSQDGGLKWTYCDLNGAGSNTGLSFETTQLGVMTVAP